VFPSAESEKSDKPTVACSIAEVARFAASFVLIRVFRTDEEYEDGAKYCNSLSGR